MTAVLAPTRAWAVGRYAGSVVLAACFALLVAPFCWDIAHYAGWGSGQIAESSIYSLDKAKYFHDFFTDGSIFNAGEHVIFPLNYFVFYGLWELLDFVFSDITSYFVLVIGFFLLGFTCFVLLFKTLTESKGIAISQFHLAAAGVTALLYFSSISIFDYIKSNILFALPYLILPALIYFASRYLRTANAWVLLPYLAVTAVLTDFNVAHTLILIGFLDVFLILQSWDQRMPFMTAAKRIIGVNLLLLPAMSFLLAVVIGNALYSGSLATFATAVSENMYSENARYLNIFTQLTDWGLFGSWNGELYYGYSPFYEPGPVWCLAFLPYGALAYAAATTSAPARNRRFTIALLIVAALVFATMLGNNNPVYNFLYSHLVLFQIFRNITKLAPLLYLLLLMSVYLFIDWEARNNRRYWIAMALLIGALAYNIPFWSYAGYFFRDRAVRDVPPDWQQAASYLNEHASPQSKILTLPAIYINDVFEWDGKPTWVQGSLLDILARNESYRLSECCIGAPRFQRDAKRLFVPSKRSVRKLDINYSALSKFVKKYGLDYVVVSSDLRSEYQTPQDIQAWLARDRYKEVASFGKVSIFLNRANEAHASRDVDLSYQRINSLRYNVAIRGLRGDRRIEFPRPFNALWGLYLTGPSNPRGPAEVLDEIVHIFVPADFSSTHTVSPNAGNSWVVSESYIKRRFPAAQYAQNPDGSINVEAGLYFKPQGYTFALLLLAGVLCFFCVACIIAAAVLMRCPLNLRNVAVALGALIVCAVVVFVIYGTRRSESPLWQRQAQADHVFDAIRNSGNVASEVYAPSSCNGGTGKCVRFYASSPTGNHYWGWEYDPNAKTLRQCLSYSDVSGPCTQPSRTALAGVNEFDARPVVAAAGQSAGVSLLLAADSLSRAATITPGNQPFDAGATAVAPLPPLGKDVEAGNPRVVFYSVGTPPQKVSFSLLNFGLYAKYMGQPWKVSACGSPASVGTDANSRAVNPVKVLVTPRQVGSCTFEVAAAPGQNIASPASVEVSVMGPLSWSQTAAQANRSLIFPSSIAVPKVLTAYKRLGTENLSLSKWGANCTSADVTFGLPGTSAGPDAAVSKVVSFKPVHVGSCTQSLRDQYARFGDLPITAKILVMGDLSFASGRFLGATNLSFQGTTDLPKSITVYKTHDGVPISPALAVNGCSAVAAFAFERGSAAVSRSGSLASARILVRPANFGRCSVTFGDQYGGDDRAVSARIVVAPAVVFESTISAAQNLTVYRDTRPTAASLLNGGCDQILSATRTGPTKALRLRPVRPGSCQSEIDAQGIGRERLTALVKGDLSLAPSTQVASVSLQFRNAQAPAQAVTFYKTWDRQPLTPTLVRNGCAQMIGFYLQTPHVPSGLSAIPASTEVLVKPIKPGSCTARFGDQYGANDRSVTIRVQVGK